MIARRFLHTLTVFCLLSSHGAGLWGGPKRARLEVLGEKGGQATNGAGAEAGSALEPDGGISVDGLFFQESSAAIVVPAAEDDEAALADTEGDEGADAQVGSNHPESAQKPKKLKKKRKRVGRNTHTKNPNSEESTTQSPRRERPRRDRKKKPGKRGAATQNASAAGIHNYEDSGGAGPSTQPIAAVKTPREHLAVTSLADLEAEYTHQQNQHKRARTSPGAEKEAVPKTILQTSAFSAFHPFVPKALPPQNAPEEMGEFQMFLDVVYASPTNEQGVFTLKNSYCQYMVRRIEAFLKQNRRPEDPVKEAFKQLSTVLTPWSNSATEVCNTLASLCTMQRGTAWGTPDRPLTKRSQTTLNEWVHGYLHRQLSRLHVYYRENSEHFDDQPFRSDSFLEPAHREIFIPFAQICLYALEEARLLDSSDQTFAFLFIAETLASEHTGTPPHLFRVLTNRTLNLLPDHAVLEQHPAPWRAIFLLTRRAIKDLEAYEENLLEGRMSVKMFLKNAQRWNEGRGLKRYLSELQPCGLPEGVIQDLTARLDAFNRELQNMQVNIWMQQALGTSEDDPAVPYAPITAHPVYYPGYGTQEVILPPRTPPEKVPLHIFAAELARSGRSDDAILHHIPNLLTGLTLTHEELAQHFRVNGIDRSNTALELDTQTFTLQWVSCINKLFRQHPAFFDQELKLLEWLKHPKAPGGTHQKDWNRKLIDGIEKEWLACTTDTSVAAFAHFAKPVQLPITKRWFAPPKDIQERFEEIQAWINAQAYEPEGEALKTLSTDLSNYQTLQIEFLKAYHAIRKGESQKLAIIGKALMDIYQQAWTVKDGKATLQTSKISLEDALVEAYSDFLTLTLKKVPFLKIFLEEAPRLRFLFGRFNGKNGSLCYKMLNGHWVSIHAIDYQMLPLPALEIPKTVFNFWSVAVLAKSSPIFCITEMEAPPEPCARPPYVPHKKSGSSTPYLDEGLHQAFQKQWATTLDFTKSLPPEPQSLGKVAPTFALFRQMLKRVKAWITADHEPSWFRPFTETLLHDQAEAMERFFDQTTHGFVFYREHFENLAQASRFLTAGWGFENQSVKTLCMLAELEGNLTTSAPFDISDFFNKARMFQASPRTVSLSTSALFYGAFCLLRKAVCLQKADCKHCVGATSTCEMFLGHVHWVITEAFRFLEILPEVYQNVPLLKDIFHATRNAAVHGYEIQKSLLEHLVLSRQTLSPPLEGLPAYVQALLKESMVRDAETVFGLSASALSCEALSAVLEKKVAEITRYQGREQRQALHHYSRGLQHLLQCLSKDPTHTAWCTQQWAKHNTWAIKLFRDDLPLGISPLFTRYQTLPFVKANVNLFYFCTQSARMALEFERYMTPPCFLSETEEGLRACFSTAKTLNLKAHTPLTSYLTPQGHLNQTNYQQLWNALRALMKLHPIHWLTAQSYFQAAPYILSASWLIEKLLTVSERVKKLDLDVLPHSVHDLVAVHRYLTPFAKGPDPAVSPRLLDKIKEAALRLEVYLHEKPILQALTPRQRTLFKQIPPLERAAMFWHIQPHKVREKMRHLMELIKKQTARTQGGRAASGKKAYS